MTHLLKYAMTMLDSLVLQWLTLEPHSSKVMGLNPLSK